jgi:CpeT/CpcT family (DUF1001)
METRAWIAGAAIGVLVPASAIASPIAQSMDPTIESQVPEVVSHLVGVMSTTAQVRQNPQKPDVTMTTCVITVSGAMPRQAHLNPVYLYQEQALSHQLHKPYRQRFLQISASLPSRTVRSQSWRPIQLEPWINFCQRPSLSRIVPFQAFGDITCAVFLKKSGDRYEGVTLIGGCPTQIRGAVRMTNQITLHAAGMDTWDRGYDAAGKQVWGAKSESYQYRWIKQGE